MNNAKKLGAALVALALAAAAATATAGPGAPDANDDAVAYGRTAALAPIEGTWAVQITPYNCQTGVPVVPARFSSLITFGARGTLMETTSNATFAPGQRSPGLGSWERSGANSYHALFQAFLQFTQAPYTRGVQRVGLEIELLDANRWQAELDVSFLDFSGTPTRPAGCATVEATRLQ